MSDGLWRVDFARRAEKDIARLDPPVGRRVLATVGELDADARTIKVQRVLPRGRAYER
jgi:mRNA-degrading endonuclease RelE of RelBE toxin-antitoxin system